jgi:hypothetical protein
MRQDSLREFGTEDRELRRDIAKASLREGWQLAKSSGSESITDTEIDREVTAVRNARTRNT